MADVDAQGPGRPLHRGKVPQGPARLFPADARTAFTAAVKAGRFPV